MDKSLFPVPVSARTYPLDHWPWMFHLWSLASRYEAFLMPFSATVSSAVDLKVCSRTHSSRST